MPTSTPLNILAVSKVMSDHGIHGGMEVYFDHLIRGLVERGHAVTVVTSKLESGVVDRGFPLRWEEVSVAASASRRDWMQGVAQRPAIDGAGTDVILSNSFAASSMNDGGVPIVSLLNGTGLVDFLSAVRLFSNRRDSLKSVFHAGSRALFFYASQKNLVRRSAHVIAVSREILRSVVKTYGLSSQKVSVINSPVDTGLFTPPENRLFLKPSADRPCRLVSCGTLSRQKGFEDVIRALGILKDARRNDFTLKIAGQGPEEGRLRSLADRLGVAESVSFEGQLARDQMGRLYRTGDLFVFLTYREEGFPLVISEALACGLPPLVTPVGGNSSAVVDCRCGKLVPLGSPQCAASTIAELGDDVETRKRLSKSARDYAVDELDYRVVAARTEAVLASAAGERAL